MPCNMMTISEKAFQFLFDKKATGEMADRAKGQLIFDVIRESTAVG